ncbi:hypothetical protein Tco_1431843, partial [Tanacetum coccineum]
HGLSSAFVFQCKYAEEFWSKVKAKMDVISHIKNWWDIIDEFVDMYCGNSINSIIRMRSLAASVYLIWRERNCRIFRNEKRSSKELFDIFNEIIRMRLVNLKAKKSVAVTSAQKRWNVSIVCSDKGIQCNKVVVESRNV